MITINVVAQSGHAWTEIFADVTSAKQAIPAIVKEHGDIERVELLNADGSVNYNLWTIETSRAASALRAIPSPTRSEQSRINGRKGGRKPKTK